MLLRLSLDVVVVSRAEKEYEIFLWNEISVRFRQRFQLAVFYPDVDCGALISRDFADVICFEQIGIAFKAACVEVLQIALHYYIAVEQVQRNIIFVLAVSEPLVGSHVFARVLLTVDYVVDDGLFPYAVASCFLACVFTRDQTGGEEILRCSFADMAQLI